MPALQDHMRSTAKASGSVGIAQTQAPPAHQIWGLPELDSNDSYSNSTSREDQDAAQDGSLARRLRGIVLRSESSPSDSQGGSGECSGGTIDSGCASQLGDTHSAKVAICGAQEAQTRPRGYGPFWHSQRPVKPRGDMPPKPCGDTEEDAGSSSEDEGSNAENSKAPTGTWSAGSEFHNVGKCRPCHYVSTKAGCVNGAECLFCHLDHPKRRRPRPCKSKRAKCKRLAASLEVAASGPEQVNAMATELSVQRGYLRAVFKSRMRQHEEADHRGPGREGAAEQPLRP